MPNLYEIKGMYQQLLNMSMEGDIDDETFQDTLESIEGELEVKAQNIIYVINELKAEEEKFKKEKERLDAQKKALSNKAASLKTYLETTMRDMGVTKIKTDFNTLNIQNNPPSVIIDDAEAIPENYKVPQPSTIDKESIAKVLKTGGVVEGAHLEQGSSLRIK